MGLVLFTMLFAAPALAIVMVVAFVRAFRRGGRSWWSAGRALTKAVLVAAVLIALYVTPVVLPAGYNKVADWMVGPSSAPVTLVKELLGFYPVKVTIEAVVENKPIKVERVFECYRKITLHEGCFLCPKWSQSIQRVAQQLPSGNWITMELPTYCRDAHDERRGLEKLPNYGVEWSDKFILPNRIETYGTSHRPLIERFATDSKVLMSSLKTTYDRLSQYTSKPNNPDGQPYWVRSGITLEDGKIGPSDMVSVSVVLIPSNVWGLSPLVVKRLNQIKKIAALGKFSFEEGRELAPVLRKVRDEYRDAVGKNDFQFINRRPFIKFVPMVPTINGAWKMVLNKTSIGVKLLANNIKEKNFNFKEYINFKNNNGIIFEYKDSLFRAYPVITHTHYI